MDTVTLVRSLERHVRMKKAGYKPSGQEVAELLQEIAKREVQEGGPYAAPDALSEKELNEAIGKFLLTYGVRLPALDEHLAENSVHLEMPPDSEKIGRTHAAAEELLKRVHWEAKIKFSSLPDPIAKRGIGVIDQTIRTNLDTQMVLMPLYVRDAIGDEDVADKQFLAELGFASACFWSAFIIYDDFWDKDEASMPELLPIANYMSRHFIDFFSKNASHAFKQFFDRTMDRLDAANVWEIQNCRTQMEGNTLYVPDRLPEFDDYAVKFYPASGHVIGPVALLLKAGYKLDSLEVRSFLLYCRHYLVAMQLNDDIHDWREDLSRGHMSTAVTCLLELWRQKYPQQSRINLDDCMDELEWLFWNRVLVPQCGMVMQHAKLARRALNKAEFLGDTSWLHDLIDRNEKIARVALQEFQQTKEFLAHFMPA